MQPWDENDFFLTDRKLVRSQGDMVSKSTEKCYMYLLVTHSGIFVGKCQLAGCYFHPWSVASNIRC